MPMAANYEITPYCNLNCIHCYRNKDSNSYTELDLQEWEKTFILHKKNGVNGAYLTGGEPLLRPDIIYIANRIFGNLSIVTNGTIKVPEEIQRRIFVSIDGPAKIHNLIRKANIFSKAIQNIKGDKRVILTPTLSTINFEAIDELVQITRECNIEGITFSAYTSHHNNSDDPLLLTQKHLDFVVSKLLDVWKKNKDIVFLTPYVINLFKTKQHIKNCYFRGKSFISFNSELRVKKPCVMGPNVDCSTCGCIVPMIAYSLRQGDIRSWLIFDRLFPERYGF